MLPLKLDRPLFIVDVETHDKVPPERSHIVELSFELWKPGAEIFEKEWSTLVKPPVPISAGATGVHGITNEMVENAPKWEDLAKNIAHGFQNCDFSGYSVKFDMRVLDAEMKRVRVEWTYKGARLLDPYKLWIKVRPRTLAGCLKEHVGREPTQAHRARGDVIDARDALLGVLAKYKDEIPETVQGLHDYAFKEPHFIDSDGLFVWVEGVPTCNFGKHKGVAMANMPKHYFRWITEQGFAPDVKHLAAEAIEGRLPQKVSV